MPPSLTVRVPLPATPIDSRSRVWSTPPGPSTHANDGRPEAPMAAARTQIVASPRCSNPWSCSVSAGSASEMPSSASAPWTSVTSLVASSSRRPIVRVIGPAHPGTVPAPPTRCGGGREVGERIDVDACLDVLEERRVAARVGDECRHARRIPVLVVTEAALRGPIQRKTLPSGPGGPIWSVSWYWPRVMGGGLGGVSGGRQIALGPALQASGEVKSMVTRTLKG